MNFAWNKAASLALVGSLAAVGLTACGSRSDASSGGGGGTCSPGITDTSINVGQSSLQSGPGAPYKVLVDADKVVFDAVNAKGGVKMGDGKTRKIKFTALDDAYDPARTVVNVKRLVEKDNVAVLYGNSGSSNTLAIVGYTTQHGIPLLMTGSGDDELAAQLKAGKAMIADSELATVAFENHVMIEGLKSQDPHAKIAILYPNDDTGTGQLKNVKKFIPEAGMSIVGTQSYEDTATNLDSQVSILANTHADALLFLGIGPFATMALKKAHELNWNPIKWIISSDANPAIIDPAGAGAADKLHAAGWGEAPTIKGGAASAGVKEVIAWEKANHFDPNNPFYASAYETANLFLQVLEATKGCTSKDIYDAAQHITFKSDLTLPGITFAGSTTDPSYIHQASDMTYDPATHTFVPGKIYNQSDFQ